MKRFWFGVGLLVLFLVLGMVTAFVLQTAQKPIVQSLEDAAVCGLAGDLSQGAVLAGCAEERWQKSWHWMAAVTSHDPMDEIDCLFAQLPAFAANGQGGDFAACCGQIVQLIKAITDGYRFSWWNLL